MISDSFCFLKLPIARYATRPEEIVIVVEGTFPFISLRLVISHVRLLNAVSIAADNSAGARYECVYEKTLGLITLPGWTRRNKQLHFWVQNPCFYTSLSWLIWSNWLMVGHIQSPQHSTIHASPFKSDFIKTRSHQTASLNRRRTNFEVLQLLAKMKRNNWEIANSKSSAFSNTEMHNNTNQVQTITQHPITGQGWRQGFFHHLFLAHFWSLFCLRWCFLYLVPASGSPGILLWLCIASLICELVPDEYLDCMFCSPSDYDIPIPVDLHTETLLCDLMLFWPNPC